MPGIAGRAATSDDHWQLTRSDVGPGLDAGDAAISRDDGTVMEYARLKPADLGTLVVQMTL